MFLNHRNYNVSKTFLWLAIMLVDILYQCLGYNSVVMSLHRTSNWKVEYGVRIKLRTDDSNTNLHVTVYYIAQ